METDYPTSQFIKYLNVISTDECIKIEPDEVETISHPMSHNVGEGRGVQRIRVVMYDVERRI